MLCGPIVGGLLQLLIQISNSKNILEIGMFTGYSALKMAQVLPHGGIVHTCELMKKHKQTATKWFSKAGMLSKIQIHEGPALNTLDNFQAGSYSLMLIKLIIQTIIEERIAWSKKEELLFLITCYGVVRF
jgi:caffeoyl-CoA O-methyltransferase